MNTYQFLGYLVSLFFGIVFASYCSGVIYRLPKSVPLCGLPGIGIPPRCFSCKTNLKFYEYYPVLFWLTLRRACSHCGAVVPWKFYIADALIIVSFVLNFHILGFNEEYIFLSVYSCEAIIMGMIFGNREQLPAILVIFFAFTALVWQVSKLQSLFDVIYALVPGVIYVFILLKLAQNIIAKESGRAARAQVNLSQYFIEFIKIAFISLLWAPNQLQQIILLTALLCLFIFTQHIIPTHLGE